MTKVGSKVDDKVGSWILWSDHATHVTIVPTILRITPLKMIGINNSVDNMIE